MNDFVKFLKLEKLAISLDFAEQAQYRLNFFLAGLAMLIFQIIVPVFAIVLYTSTNGFPGWSYGNIVLLIGYVSLAEAISHVFIGGIVWNTMFKVKDGTLDILLLAPTNALSYFINRSNDIEDIGRVMGALLVVIFAYYLEPFSLMTALFLLAYLPIAIIFYGAIAVLVSALAIRYVDSWRFYDFMNIFSQFSKYPLKILPLSLKILFLVFFPIAAIGIVPVSVVLGKLPFVTLYSAAAGLLLTAVVLLYWHHVMRHYASAGG